MFARESGQQVTTPGIFKKIDGLGGEETERGSWRKKKIGLWAHQWSVEKGN